MTYDTTTLLADLRRETEDFLRVAREEWAAMPHDALSAQPAPGAWSAIQCLEHLNFYGRHYLPALTQAMRHARGAARQPRPTFTPGWLGGYFTRLMETDGRGRPKTKMPSPRNAVPTPQPNVAATLATFIAQQEAMLELLTEAAQMNLRRVQVPTSLSRWLRLSLGDTLRFYTAHHRRHVLQAGRALGKG